MISNQFERAIERYAVHLSTLENATPTPTVHQVLEVLSSRDAVYRACVVKPPEVLSAASLALLPALDERLKKKSQMLARIAKLAEWRAYLHPPKEAWWWYIEPTATFWSRTHWVMDAVVLLLFTVSLSILSDIITRFMSGGPDILGSLLIIIQAALTLVFTGGAITKTGRGIFDQVLKSLSISEKHLPWVRIGMAVLVFGTLIGFRLLLPSIAILYNNWGVIHDLGGRYSNALYDYSRALKLNPDYIEARYNLGSLYEKLGDSSSAQTEYRIAVRGGLDAAYNNLARLYILDGRYSLAVPLLLNGLDKAQDDEVRYDLLKNLGWVRLKQNRLSDAKAQLEEAISLNGTKAPAHCLIAQVLDGLKRPDESVAEWEFCLKYADARRPDEDDWIAMARTHLGADPQ